MTENNEKIQKAALQLINCKKYVKIQAKQPLTSIFVMFHFSY